jgi:hypothetical protein
MIPNKRTYGINKTTEGYQVTTIYNLHHLNKNHPTGPIFKTKKKATLWLKATFELDLWAYEALKQQGRSFPDNN